MRTFHSLRRFAARHPFAVGLFGLLLPILALLGDVLLGFNSNVVGSPTTDTPTLFWGWREFASTAIRSGDFPLWNPHVAGGYPFFSGFQSALLYPLNAIYLLLPVGRALSLDVALHLFLAGAMFYGWMLRKGLKPFAAWTGALCVMLCGPLFLRLHAGHLTPLAVMAWAPLVFMSVDELCRKPSLRIGLVGAFAVAMQAFAGFPQFVFYTAVVSACFALALVFGNRLFTLRDRLVRLGCAAAIFAGGFALAAVQILTGLAASGESVRSSGLSFETAAVFSFPPENLLTLLTPNFFGIFAEFRYWGSAYFWEVCGFFSLTGLVLAVRGACCAPPAFRRDARVALVLCAVVVVLALGAHTPLFRFLFLYAPGFANFRSVSKFFYFAVLFAALLATIGFDSVLRAPDALVKAAKLTSVAAGATALFAALFALGRLDGLLRYLFDVVIASGESYVPLESYAQAEFMRTASAHAAWALAGSTVCLLLVAFAFSRRRADARALVLGALACAELLLFARQTRTTFDPATERPHTFERDTVAQFGTDRYTALSENYLAFVELNYFSSAYGQSVLGYDPLILRRWAEVIATSQNAKPEQATAYIWAENFHPVFSMLRCRWLVVHENGETLVAKLPSSLPHLALVPRWRTVSNPDQAKRRNEILRSVLNPKFDPRREVILEQEPKITANEQAESKMGSVKLLSQTSDSLEIEAAVSSPQMLLITDAYANGWRAEPLAGSSQKEYEVLPANWAIRAVPLGAGKHRLRVFYDPPGWRLGKWISALSLFVFGALWLFAFGRKRDRKRKGSTVEFDRTLSPVSPESISATDENSERQTRAL